MNHWHAHDLRRARSVARCVRPIALAFVLCVLSPLEGRAQTLPSGWAFRNVGAPAVTGRASYSSGIFTVEGAGIDTWGTSDQFAYVYRQVTGDTSAIVRVASLENVQPWSKAGVMIRETLAAGSRHAFALVSPSNGLAFQRRAATGGTTAHTSGGTARAPVWLKLERRGSTFTMSRSADGAAWTRITSATISMASTVYVGLATTSHAPSTLATATFAGVLIGRPLPVGWSSGDVGAPAVRGSVSYTGSAFTVRGAGTDIWSTADQFTWAYRQVSGDVDVVARVSSLQRVHDWTKAGVMVRASLRRDAAHASTFVSAGRGLAFQRRPATAVPSLHTSGGSGAAPVWVKLERRGSAVTAFRSADGVTWRMVGSETLSLPSVFYVGLAVTSHDARSAAAGVFSNVSVTQRSASTNTPPTVALTAPAAGATFAAPASIALSATAADVNGAVVRVDFYNGATRIATDTTSPYSFTWTNVAAGSYSLTAVAVDNAGASTRSAARTVYVNTAGALTTAVFAPSPDHNTSSVTSYRLEIFTAGANPATARAMAVQNLGKPAIVSGVCRANIATTISGLPSGSYFATVRASGPGGLSSRTTSATFRR